MATECWPNFFPASCPPSDAVQADGWFYRLMNNPPNDEDFVSNQELNLRKFPHQEWRDECLACGLSMFQGLSDAEKCQKKYGQKDKFIGRIIVHGLLKPHFGRVKATPNAIFKSHYTWWVPTGVEGKELIDAFRELEKAQNMEKNNESEK